MLLYAIFVQSFKADLSRFSLALSVKTGFLFLDFDGNKFVIAAYFSKHSLQVTLYFFLWF